MLERETVKFFNTDWLVEYDYTPAEERGAEPQVELLFIWARPYVQDILELLRPEVIEQIEAHIAKSYNTPGSIT